jgi:CRP/FNR family transcriptional regulator
MNTNNSSLNIQLKTHNCNQCWLKDFSVFKDCPKELLDELFAHKQLRQFKKNEMLFRKNDPFQGVFCIQEGVIKVSTSRNNNKEFILWFARPGDIVGIDSFVSCENYSFNALAVESVSTCFIPASDFNALISKNPVVSRKLMKDMCEKINFIEDRITSMSRKKIREQFAEMLISMSMKNKNAIAGNMPINHSIKDLANIIGTTKYYLYKILSDFNSKKVVTMHNKKLVIKDFDKLSLIAIGDEPAN